jgi:hypothetical protein
LTVIVNRSNSVRNPESTLSLLLFRRYLALEPKLMRYKNVALIALVILFLGAATSLALFQSDGQKNKKRVDEPATVIQEGIMTEKQRQHSKLFKHSVQKLLDIAASRLGDVEVEEDTGYSLVLPSTSQKFPVFQSALCNADAVVVGTIMSKSSQLTDEGNFIFTDHGVTVDELIKNNASAPILPATTITTTRDGGVVELNNRILSAKREDFVPPLVGKQYLLFLRFIPETGSYLMYGNGTFQIESGNLTALGPGAAREQSSAGRVTPEVS